MGRRIAAWLVIGLLGCTGSGNGPSREEAAAVANRIAYACEDGSQILLEVLEGDPGSGRVTRGSSTWLLPHVPSASGARFEGEGVQLFTKGDEALFEAAGVQTSCRAAELRGMYRYMADAGRFTDCASARSLPVAQEGDNAALESAYTKARQEPGAPLLVRVTGRVEPRPALEGGAMEDQLVVDEFLEVRPGEACTAPALSGTRWNLVRLEGQPVASTNPLHAPHLVLDAGSSRMAGSSGCNRMAGAFELSGTQLRFGPIAGTRMACREGMETESRFLAALGRVAALRSEGAGLELLDAQGAVLASFVAAPPE